MKTIKEYRADRGLTQKEMAKRMDLGLSTYQQKEQGLIGWNTKDLIKVKKILKVEFDKLKELSE